MGFPQTTGKPHINYLLLHLPVVCKTGDRSIETDTVVQLREIQCRWCGKIFCICQSCWRGQAYCSDECRSTAKRKAHQEAQKRYRRTEKGKKAHREAENRRRMGLSKKNKAIVDDAATTLQCGLSKIERSTNLNDKEQLGWAVNSTMRIGRCHFCGSLGVIVDRFPRRGYGKQNYGMKLPLCNQQE